jgi:hypothetical protein
MATSSKFVLLNDAVLMEYIYADQDQINVPGNEFRIPTTTAPLWKTQNLHTGESQILNDDAASIIQDGLPVGTANVRNHSFAQVSNSKIAELDINRIVFYNDYDPDLTPSNLLPISFNTGKSPVYDTVRLHLVQGFNFQGNSGFAVSIKAKKLDGKNLILSNILYNKEDSWETLNPSSFLFGGRVYDSYVEFRVLALYNLIFDYWYTTLNGDSVAEKITDQSGLSQSQNIQIDFRWLSNPTFVDGQNYLTYFEGVEAEIPTKDQFESISAYIAESEFGDYVEFYGKYNNDIIENFILDINASGYDYMLLHDLTVSEYVYNQTNQTYAWIKTADVQLSQTDEYDLPNTYRPVIKNGNAISFKIDYVLRLYNRNDNSQIWKTSSMISTKVNKYGRTLKAINLGTNPIQMKVYNQLVSKEINLQRVIEPVISNIRYLTAFTDNNAISIAWDNLSTGTITGTTIERVIQDGTTLRIFPQSLGRIMVSKGVSYLRFTLYQKKNNANSILDLSGLGDLILSFGSNTDEDISFEEFPTTSADKARGQVVFRLNEAQSTKVLGLRDREFNVYIRNEKGTTAGLTGATSVNITNTAAANAASARGEKQLLYTGKFYSSAEYAKLAELDRVEELLGTITEKNGQIGRQESIISERNATIITKDNYLADLETRLSKSNSDLSQALKNNASFLASDAIEDAEFQATIDSLNNQLSASNTAGNQKTTQIQNLTNEKVNLTNENNRLLALINTLNAQIASLRATPTAPPVSVAPPILTRNFGITSVQIVGSSPISIVANPNATINASFITPPPASIINTNASNFSVSQIVAPKNPPILVNVQPAPPIVVAVAPPSVASTIPPSAFQNFGISAKGSAAKGTNVINRTISNLFRR